ncbi:hypothetical protein [Allomuricauda sp. SCSIO 65647]|uniref:hypothetical protein n=1 Tax=Allomuricauda sp. SCSIO 65647 TaxID=2908843 RepID=UPI001F3D3843|nr:hypothetical protein [Muricauda sp. SCSIO 65647]UJH66785.1 hypothetical protein L0P89_12550 [Muricauda sp. SCSIO 65647]
MKQKRILLIVAALMSFWLMVSFRFTNACEFANSNIQFVKERTEEAIQAPDLKMSKYYAYRALNGIFNSKENFSECGCEEAIINITLASENLKEATKASNIEDTKVFLQIAMQNTLSGINALRTFGERGTSKYGDRYLSLNTHEINFVDDMMFEEVPKSEAMVRIEESLSKFEDSMNKIVETVDCERARPFILQMQNETIGKLANPDLTEKKQYYHNRVFEITEKALTKLEVCR